MTKITEENLVKHLASMTDKQYQNLVVKINEERDSKNSSAIKTAGPIQINEIKALKKEFEDLTNGEKFEYEVHFSGTFSMGGCIIWEDDLYPTIEDSWAGGDIDKGCPSELKEILEQALRDADDSASDMQDLSPDLKKRLKEFKSRIDNFMKNRKTLAKKLKVSEDVLSEELGMD